MSLSPFYGFSGQEVQGWLPARVGVAESVESMNSVGAACREGVRIRCPVEEQNGKDREHVCRRVCAGRVSGISFGGMGHGQQCPESRAAEHCRHCRSEERRVGKECRL